jgi:CubicO group peptidase (beta-lactamase class C family)
MTKIATATAVVQLAERARLDLDDPVSRYVPEFPRPSNRAPATIRHLLSHSSGLPNPIPVRWVHPASSSGPDRREFALRVLRRYRKLNGTPGATASYSNLGYVILGEVVAAASGQSYENYLRENLLAPLRITRTDFVYRADLVKEAATGYQLRRSPLTPLYRLMLPKGIIGKREGRFVSFNRFYVDGPAYGGLLGSVEDAARFLALHTSGGASGDAAILSTAAVASIAEDHRTGSEAGRRPGLVSPPRRPGDRHPLPRAPRRRRRLLQHDAALPRARSRRCRDGKRNQLRQPAHCTCHSRSMPCRHDAKRFSGPVDESRCPALARAAALLA